jgi:hypothetical protein
MGKNIRRKLSCRMGCGWNGRYDKLLRHENNCKHKDTLVDIHLD